MSKDHELLASNKDRDEATKILSQGVEQGRLTSDDFEERLQEINEAKTIEDINESLKGLPQELIVRPKAELHSHSPLPAMIITFVFIAFAPFLFGFAATLTKTLAEAISPPTIEEIKADVKTELRTASFAYSDAISTKEASTPKELAQIANELEPGINPIQPGLTPDKAKEDIIGVTEERDQYIFSTKTSDGKIHAFIDKKNTDADKFIYDYK